MISAGDFRNGVCFEMDGQVFTVVEFQHVKPGKGSAFVRTKYKNVKTGSVVERTFNPNEKFESAQLNRNDMQYIYADGDLYYFMDQETFDQKPIHKDSVGDAIKFLKEEMICKVLSYKGEVFSVELPITVDLEITECEPGVRGDTTNNASKYATLETGAVVKVPLFVNQNEIVRVDTRTGEYLERAN
ncbi:MAG TPA: elongation factor P [Saccharofermentans sp.]|jgi:elongation factor P|nr:elongation factor P [Clostridia bacterium]NLX67980.1 elongation factor P [Clostridiaceae bacterium]HOO48398.1 elongation factor P [Saccharofermentans sp.]HPE28227.1 elongation factor P [Saccharofermentans sp.]HPJ81490.1 elongation factor P [Saccharofermentans sp.]